MFEADRAAAEAESDFFSEGDDASRASALTRAVEQALGEEDDPDAELRLERLVDLCGAVGGPQMVDLLIRVLDHPEPDVRVGAGETLQGIGYARYAELAQGIERALDAGGLEIALTELPFVILDIREPSPLKLLKLLLKHSSGEVVAATLEALLELGDPAAIPAIKALQGDAREVVMDEEEEGSASIGELAQMAVAELGE